MKLWLNYQKELLVLNPLISGCWFTNSRRRSSCKNAWMELRLKWGFGLKTSGNTSKFVFFERTWHDNGLYVFLGLSFFRPELRWIRWSMVILSGINTPHGTMVDWIHWLFQYMAGRLDASKPAEPWICRRNVHPKPSSDHFGCSRSWFKRNFLPNSHRGLRAFTDSCWVLLYGCLI